MKLNFWQILGLILLLVGGYLMFKEKGNKPSTDNKAPATQSR